jgi:hypothetical protein
VRSTVPIDPIVEPYSLGDELVEAAHDIFPDVGVVVLLDHQRSGRAVGVERAKPLVNAGRTNELLGLAGEIDELALARRRKRDRVGEELHASSA